MDRTVERCLTKIKVPDAIAAPGTFNYLERANLLDH
jgi:hypothetical protein